MAIISWERGIIIALLSIAKFFLTLCTKISQNTFLNFFFPPVWLLFCRYIHYLYRWELYSSVIFYLSVTLSILENFISCIIINNDYDKIHTWILLNAFFSTKSWNKIWRVEVSEEFCIPFLSQISPQTTADEDQGRQLSIMSKTFTCTFSIKWFFQISSYPFM